MMRFSPFCACNWIIGAISIFFAIFLKCNNVNQILEFDLSLVFRFFPETATKWGCPSDETKKPGVRVTIDVKR